ncbi:MAG: cytochrome P450 [Nocardiaceae bacterium]|nr:cytochrome P450 [Nocardiaceae bacterium]
MSAPGVSRVQQIGEHAFVVLGYEPARQILSDRRACNNPSTAGVGEDPAHNGRGVSMQVCDGAQHTRLRAMIAPALSPKASDAIIAGMPAHAEALLAELGEHGSGDLIEDYIAPLIRRGIGRLLGIPEDDQARILVIAEDSTVADETGAPAADALYDYMSALVRSKIEHPGDDLCTELARALTDGRIDEAEAFGTATLMIIAGYDTTVGFLAMAALTLLLTPMLRQQLVADPDSNPIVVEELLRFITPTKGVWTRFATSDIEIDGTTIPFKSQIIVDLMAANRDSSRFDEPDVFNPARNDDKHLAFGYGTHFCPGANSAKRQSLAALNALLPRMESMELSVPVSELQWHQNRFSRRPLTLPVTIQR